MSRKKATDNVNIDNNDRLWAAFGFRKSPYNTRALSSEEGECLLVGREDEVNWLIRQLKNSPRIPILIGDNGVGKTSIANVAAYKLSTESIEADQRFLVLDLNKLTGLEFKASKDFEQALYYEIVLLLLHEKAFLRQRGISIIYIFYVWLRKWISGVSAGNIELDISKRTDFFCQVAQKWLEKCFESTDKGGIICIIDNLESIGTSSQVQKTLEYFRDKLFSAHGLRWILCGTSISVNGVLASPLLDGYIKPKKIAPICEEKAPELVQCRIDYYKTDLTPQSPVDKELFQNIYVNVVNKQLRMALDLCEDFAEHLFVNESRRALDRSHELELWLKQKGGRPDTPVGELSERTLDLFINIADFGGECMSSDYQLIGANSVKDLDDISEPLISFCLLVKIETDNGFMLRVTKNGWLVCYYVRNSRL